MDTAMQPTQANEISVVAATLARAFVDDPVITILFGAAPPMRKVTRFFEIICRIQHGHGHSYHTPGYEAASVWAPPGEWKLKVSQIARNAPAFVTVFGKRFIPNLGVLGLLEKNHPTDPHYYLEFIGTDPQHQGKGMGGALMQPMIDRCDREGVGAYLESSKESNLAFYGRFGFEVTKVLTHKAGPQQWLMWRDPK